MTNLNIQQGLNIEVVGTEIIKKLYEAALSVPTPLEGELDDAYMSGNLLVDKTYRTYVSYLTTRFHDLHINVTTSYYIPFEDSNVLSVLMANNISSDGIGITEADAVNANFGGIFKNNTTITSFDEFKYFTRANTSPVTAMFGGCTNLSSIDLSETTAFSSQEFNGTAITDVNAPNLISVPNNLGHIFTGNQSLLTITSLGHITYIPSDMCWGCGNLQSVNLPAECVEIRDGAFYPYQVTGHLQTVTGLENVASFGYRCFRDLGQLLLTARDLAGAVSIGGYAFHGVKISSINSPKLMTLGDDSFSGNTALTTIECLGKVSNIPLWCFDGDNSLQTVKIPYECTNISRAAFYRNSSLTSIKQYTDSIDNWVEGVEPTTGSLSRVTTFGNNCFEDCTLLNLTLQDIQNAATIGNSSFRNTSFSGPIDLSNVSSIDWGAFKDTKITSVTFALSTINGSCFEGCKLLSEIHLANIVRNFSGSCFLGCTNLLNVDYDFTNCINLDNRCFLGCGRFDVVALTQVVNDDNTKGMGHSCFLDVSSITLLYLPKIEIPRYNDTNYWQNDWNFLSKTNIGVVYFKQLRKIYPGWFCLTTVLKLVINNTTPPQWCYPNDANTYSLWYENKTLCLAKGTSGSDIIYCTNNIYVPDSAVSTYLTDADWSAVAQYIKPISDIQTVATKTLWDALPVADKPNTLIEEYM